MAAKKGVQKSIRTRPRRRVLWPIVVSAAVVAVIAVIGLQYARQPEPSPTLAAWDPGWPPMPAKGRAVRSLKATRDAYAFVARRPDIAEYLPCYCGCEREGHTSVGDCFVDRYGPDGNPVWDQMGYT